MSTESDIMQVIASGLGRRGIDTGKSSVLGHTRVDGVVTLAEVHPGRISVGVMFRPPRYTDYKFAIFNVVLDVESIKLEVNRSVASIIERPHTQYFPMADENCLDCLLDRALEVYDRVVSWGRDHCRAER